MLHLSRSKPRVIISNLSCAATVKMCSLFPTHCTQGLRCLLTVISGGYIIGSVLSPASQVLILMSHWRVFILYWVVHYFVKCTVFLIIFPFLPITSHRQYCNLITMDVPYLSRYWNEGKLQNQDSTTNRCTGNELLATCQLTVHPLPLWR